VPPFAEQSIVYSGNQSMPFSYDNSTAGNSEATANVANLQVGRDWTKGAAETLVLWFYGDPDNAVTGQLYVKVGSAKVLYYGDITRLMWRQWNIDLAGLGINLSNITTLSIGVDGGGSGMLYVDDIALYKSAPAVVDNEVLNGDFEYWSDHPDAGNWAWVSTIQDDPGVGWYVHDTDDGGSGPWLGDGYSGYEHIVGTNGNRIAVISEGDTGSTISQNLGITFVEGETYTFSIDIFGDGSGGEHWAIGIGTEDMSNQDALQRQRNALAITASNAVAGNNYFTDPGDHTVLDPPDVFSGWQTRSVSYTATAEEVGKEIVVFFSGGFVEVAADADTCFDNATCITARLE